MSLTVVDKNGGVAGGTQTVSLTASAGDTIGVFVFDRLGSGTISDTGGNTYTAGNTSVVGGYTSLTFWSIAIASAITSVTYTSSLSTGCFLALWRVTGTGPIVASDSGAQTYFGSTTTGTDACTTASLSVTSGDGLILGGCANFSSGTMSIGTGFTLDLSQNSGQELLEHLATAVSNIASFTATTAGQVAGVGGIAFQVSGGGPTINTQPANQSVYVGQTATFTVSATTSGGSLSYQWQQYISGSWTNVGTNSSSYTTGAAGFADNGDKFQVLVTDSNGTTTSATAILTVIGAASIAWLQ